MAQSLTQTLDMTVIQDWLESRHTNEGQLCISDIKQFQDTNLHNIAQNILTYNSPMCRKKKHKVEQEVLVPDQYESRFAL